jgi:hypothetical protein
MPRLRTAQCALQGSEVLKVTCVVQISICVQQRADRAGDIDAGGDESAKLLSLSGSKAHKI